MFRRMLIGATILVALMAAPAAAQYDFTVTPGEVVVGGTVTVSGEGCQPGDVVTITLTQLSSSTRAIGEPVVVTTTTADENGEYTTTFTIPAGTDPGTYDVTATCGGSVVGHSTIEVLGDDVVTPTTPGSGVGNGPIVRTGSDLTGLGMLGAGLLTAGGIILIATKSRRSHARA